MEASSPKQRGVIETSNNWLLFLAFSLLVVCFKLSPLLLIFIQSLVSISTYPLGNTRFRIMAHYLTKLKFDTCPVTYLASFSGAFTSMGVPQKHCKVRHPRLVSVVRNLLLLLACRWMGSPHLTTSCFRNCACYLVLGIKYLNNNNDCLILQNIEVL